MPLSALHRLQAPAVLPFAPAEVAVPVVESHITLYTKRGRWFRRAAYQAWSDRRMEHTERDRPDAQKRA